MEVPLESDDHRLVGGHALDLIGPLACGLDAGFDRLGAGVHRQHHFHPRQLGELGAERAELVVVERAAHQGELIELPARGRDEPGMAMTEVERRVGGEHVQVPAAIDVGDPDALGLRDHDGQRVVVVRAVAVGQSRQLRSFC